ncbi:hypothetical protein [Truepera radiovictrix]|uniref:hypothetical protein n=1 Tax=Truepera radiovictrix TaxID=332249 RepID=UPI0005A54804|nr:hypothetical protein [Truepera radiovictrix]WMT56270.1 hypothetical protein RCV51_09665 [Truepera radiovictrix]
MMRRPHLGAPLVALLLFTLVWATAQPGPPDGRGPSRRAPSAAAFDPATALQAGEALLTRLEVLAVFEHVHGRRDEKRELRVLLGDAAGAYGRFNLDPLSLEPVPIGLEGVAPPRPAAAEPEVLFRAAERALQALSLSAVVVPERDGVKLLLVYAGRIVGELRLNHGYAPAAHAKWLEEYGRSRWRFPD